VAAWLQLDSHTPFTLDAIAQQAGLERRTVFRHFKTKEALLQAFWVWINDRITPRTLPTSLDELIAAPKETFARFDDEEGVIRASLHTPTGRAMRMTAVPARREAFRAALREATHGAPAEDGRRLETIVHLLYSASAWETMRDYAGVSGAQAGDAASWALRILVDVVRASAARTLPLAEGETLMSPTIASPTIPTIGITRPEEAPALWIVRDHIRFMGDVAGTDLAVLEIEVPPGSGTPPHRHASPEIFRILSGEMTFGRFADGPPLVTTAGAGTVVTVPSQVPHNYQNASGAPATMLVVVDQSMVAFFRDLGRPAAPPAGPPSAAEIGAVLAACERHGITLLGGPPADPPAAA
jgi:AcrR family transcriptional regulator/quercetin dioxygenase-like cupin family protein